MGVVGRGGVGDAAGAADVGVAELVGEALELVSVEVVVVPEDVVVGGAARALGGYGGYRGEEQCYYIYLTNRLNWIARCAKTS